MFDTPENRHIYEDALTRHDELMDAETKNGRAYRFGYMGKSMSDHPLLSYEHWRAGQQNAKSVEIKKVANK
jgi:hypothetical protein